MKISGVFGRLLMLFELIHGSEDVFVNCNEQWLQVRIKKRPYSIYIQPQSDELYLGTGCPVTAELLDFFEFLYLVTSCGIKINEQPCGIIIESSVTFEPVNLNIRGYIPVSCYVQRKFSFTFLNKVKGDNRHASKQPVRKKNSTSSQMENTGIYPGMMHGNKCPPAGSHVCNPSLIHFGIML